MQKLGSHITESFLMWHRTKQYDSNTESVITRTGRHRQVHCLTQVVACRYWYELTDGYWGQFNITQIPHLDPADIIPKNWRHLESMENFCGILEYLCGWSWGDSPDISTMARADHFLHPHCPSWLTMTARCKSSAHMAGGKLFGLRAGTWVLELACRTKS